MTPLTIVLGLPAEQQVQYAANTLTEHLSGRPTPRLPTNYADSRALWESLAGRGLHALTHKGIFANLGADFTSVRS